MLARIMQSKPAIVPPSGGVFEVFWAFLRLGLTSFGGPVAHLAYFRHEFVVKRRWLDEASYADLVALCQFLPGPASSQVGMALGWGRAGWAGMAAAWLAFTLPSALALIALAYGVVALGDATQAPWWQGALKGLKLAALAVVAQAIWGMARQLTPDATRRALALGTAALALAWPAWLGGSAWAGQLLPLVLCALVGWRWGGGWVGKAGEGASAPMRAPSARTGALALLVFIGLLVALPLLAAWTYLPLWAQIDGFFRAGALVFGGGHVVLPWLQASVVPAGAVSATDFMAGYGAAQAVPGPLFTFAAFLGAAMEPAVLSGLSRWQGGLVMLLALFAPAALVLVGALPFWAGWRQRPGLRASMAGVNAGVVGLLLAAWVHPMWPAAVAGWGDAALAAVAWLVLMKTRAGPVVVVLGCALAGAALSAL
ncbi:chromate efflux transporter [Hydrogenophaga sp.]|uniref:chromate efflux transporter n=1 Tax=Hydrogenophaga sp. TaxID=1904254 RepID=UPI0035B0457C